MMRNILMLMFVLLLAACGGSGGEEETEQAGEPEEQSAEESSEETDTEEAPAGETEAAEETEPEFSYEVHPETFQIVPIDDADPEVALITIDDAPDGQAVGMAETLSEMGAGAIFFVNGMFIQDEVGREALEEIHEMGFEIGNHTTTH